MDDPTPNYGGIQPLSMVVRATPPETNRAAKRIQEEIAAAAAINSPKQHNIDLNDSSWINTVRKKVNEARPNPQSAASRTIFKVPEHIRRCDPEAYGPLVVSIGPYHHRASSRGDGTARAMQDHKWRCVRYLLSRHRSQQRAGELLTRCLAELKASDADVRSCYSENPSYLDSQKLASIMLLDGCFIIHLLLKQAEKVAAAMAGEIVEDQEDDSDEEELIALDVGEDDEVEVEEPMLGMLWIWNLVVYDLLKLENQIPFFVVRKLFEVLRTPTDEGIDLVKLAFELFGGIHPNKSETFTPMPSNQVHHLLHLFHSSLVPSVPFRANSGGAGESPEWIPCATELTLSGVKFRKKETAGSFLDVTFNNGTMEVPPLRVYDYTNSLFRNLIAFEQCYPETKTYVTIYAAFLDCIIDTAEDVELLDMRGILVNRLSSDEAVAELFNRLCDQVHYAKDRNYLQDLYVEVKKYHDSKWHKWHAALMRDYFNSPWAIISFIAAFVLLLLTVEQSFFAAYSYYRPPECH